MIRILYALSTLGVMLLGLVHAILAFVRYQGFSAEAFWFFSAGLALLFAGVTNILHYQLQSPLTFTCALLVNILLALFTLTLGIKVPAPTTILVAFFALLMCLTGAFTYRQGKTRVTYLIGGNQRQTALTRKVWALALPNILSNITVPLLMLCDMAMAGRMARPESIAAVAIGAAVTHFVIGIWSLLRMGTTGFTAQAWGAGDMRALLRQLSSGSIIALTVGLILVLLRPLYIAPAADLLQDGSASLSLEAQEYLSYSFLGAPAALLLYVYNGWLIGVQRMKLVMSVSIGSNLANILFSYLLAFPLKMGVGGLALGTALAQYAAVISLAFGAWHSHRRILRLFSRKYLWHLPTLVRYFHVGKYLLIRTLTLQAVTLFFIHAGGMIGVTTLAANSLLMQLFTLFSYFMDGIAYAAEALVGEAIGARDRDRLKQVIPTVLRVGLILASIGAILYAFLPEPFLTLLTDKADVLEQALEFRYWIALVPLVSFAAFLWDGILVGATDSRTMGMAMLAAGATFFLVYAVTIHPLGAHGLWIAFLSYLTVRSTLVWLLGARHYRG